MDVFVGANVGQSIASIDNAVLVQLKVGPRGLDAAGQDSHTETQPTSAFSRAQSSS